jgi:hypothetical protein
MSLTRAEELKKYIIVMFMCFDVAFLRRECLTLTQSDPWLMIMGGARKEHVVVSENAPLKG